MALDATQFSEGDNQAALERLRELLCGETLRRLEARVAALETAPRFRNAPFHLWRGFMRSLHRWASIRSVAPAYAALTE